mmetsp:Transcript_16951/g.12121  ORF Transcript_16951/g.12121 Transcript_16951/m.12121 type:complete len:96 (-) Transcript_16951:523-810(-)
MLKEEHHTNRRACVSFQIESKILCDLSHPNIIRQLYPVQRGTLLQGLSERVCFFTVLEYASNGDLFDFIQKQGGRLTADQIRILFAQILDAVEYL